MTASLLDALVQPEPAAAGAWRAWRQDLGAFEDLAYPDMVLLAMLGPRLRQWTAEDAEAARFRGIVRQAWTRIQVQLQAIAAMQQALDNLGIRTGLCGPAARALRAEASGAVRAIPHLDLLVRRADVNATLDWLARQDWRGADAPLDTDALNWRSETRLSRGSAVLYLTWRVSSAVFYRARHAEERAFARLQPRAWNQQRFQVLDAADELVHRVTIERPEDPIPADADLPLLSLESVDWDRLRHEVVDDGVAPGRQNPLARLMTIRRRWTALPIPSFPSSDCAARSVRPDRLWREYQRQAAYLNRPADWRAFVGFLSGGARRELSRWQQKRPWK